MRVGVVQFVKGAWDTGERAAAGEFPELVTMQRDGRRLHLGHAGPRPRHRRRPRRLGDGEGDDRRPDHRLVLLDELNIVLRYDYLPIDEVRRRPARRKPADKHVIVTGRNAKDELIEIADLVTEMKLVKHPFRAGREGAGGDRVLTCPAAIGNCAPDDSRTPH